MTQKQKLITQETKAKLKPAHKEQQFIVVGPGDGPHPLQNRAANFILNLREQDTSLKMKLQAFF